MSPKATAHDAGSGAMNAAVELMVADDESVQQSANGRWTDEEHKRFIEGLYKYGKNWNKVSAYVNTRKSD
jgi:hypothetical protein